MKGILTNEEYEHVFNIFNKYAFRVYEISLTRKDKCLDIGEYFWKELYNFKNTDLYGHLANVTIETPFNIITFGKEGYLNRRLIQLSNINIVTKI
jgi:hypothetical protein